MPRLRQIDINGYKNILFTAIQFGSQLPTIITSPCNNYGKDNLLDGIRDCFKFISSNPQEQHKFITNMKWRNKITGNTQPHLSFQVTIDCDCDSDYENRQFNLKTIRYRFEIGCSRLESIKKFSLSETLAVERYGIDNGEEILIQKTSKYNVFVYENLEFYRPHISMLSGCTVLSALYTAISGASNDGNDEMRYIIETLFNVSCNSCIDESSAADLDDEDEESKYVVEPINYGTNDYRFYKYIQESSGQSYIESKPCKNNEDIVTKTLYMLKDNVLYNELISKYTQIISNVKNIVLQVNEKMPYSKDGVCGTEIEVRLRFELSNGMKVKIEQLSESAQRVFYILFCIIDNPCASMIIIRNIDNGLRSTELNKLNEYIIDKSKENYECVYVTSTNKDVEITYPNLVIGNDTHKPNAQFLNVNI